jgi:TnsA-like endonuclease N terminal
MSDVGAVRSDLCGLDDLFLAYEVGEAEHVRLELGPTWRRRWTTTWRVSGGDVVSAVRDLGSIPVAGCEPVRRFSWRQRQRHRPGLQFMVSTGRLHGFESLEERSLLLALDFTGTVEEVLSQPFRLKFETAGGETGEHVPDFLAVFRNGSRWLLDVRPAGLVKDEDAIRFAAAAEVALEAGWRYSVVAGWRPHVLSVLDALSAQRRDLEDPLGLEGELFRAVAGGSAAFGDMVTATRLPAVARAHALHLLWHRRLGTDLARPLGDRSPVWLASGSRW